MLKRYKKSLEECFALLKKIQVKPEIEISTANILQQLLLKRIVAAEVQIKKEKKERAKLKAKFGDKNSRLTKEEAQAVKARIVAIDTLIETLHKVMWVYRDIGDGIAFTYISAFDIKPLAFKQPPGFISGKKGTRLERKILRAGNMTAPEGIVTIMNDLTNCLRYGDITLAGAGRIMAIFECKSGKSKKKTDRDIRQLQNLERMMGYLKEDVIDTLYGQTGEFKRSEMHEAPIRHTDPLNRIIRQSEKEGTVVFSPEPGLAYFVSRDGEFDKISEIVKDWKPGWTIGLTNNIKFNNTAYYPFPLLLNDPFPFYNGEYIIGVAFNIGLFQERLAQKDIELISAEEFEKQGQIPNEWKGLLTFYMKSKVGVYSCLSYHIVGRLFYEFISADWFMNEAIYGMDVSQLSQMEEMALPKDS